MKLIEPDMIWYVAFAPGRALWGWRFRHVSLMGFHNGTWVNLDLHRRGVHVRVIHEHDDVQEYLTKMLTENTVIRFGPAREHRGYILRHMSCVMFAKHVLGARSGALRPDTFMRDLLSDPECKVMNEPSVDTTADRPSAATPDGACAAE